MQETTRPCLSVVMPTFNEAATIAEMLSRVLASPYTAQLIIIDDGSDDGTADILAKITDERVTCLRQTHNQGKGAALRRGFALANAEFVIVQDADLEYNPQDYAIILEPLLSGDADVVYGSRFQSSRPRRVLYFWHYVGNRLLTLLSNMFTDVNLTDMETCYKAFKTEVVQSLDLVENRFGFEPEFTAKVAAARWRIWEVGISYSGRTYAEGKKINWRDGLAALLLIVKYGMLSRRNRIAKFPR